ncbi:hypothetical protein IL306_013716 [Fusarium sp. DS 682]|nr:hypothetical protein IL306_013716 [Fusarium sp. DS 682]
MVAIRSFFVLYAAAGIASAGKCKPESRSSSFLSETSSGSARLTTTEAASASVSIVESSTTLADTTMETSIKGSTTETASSIVSTDTTETATIESSPTTLLTSFITTSADTTTTVESAASTTSAAPAVVTCPSEIEQCVGTMDIKCGYTLTGLSSSTFVSDLNECVQLCSSSADCVAFTYSESLSACYTATSLSEIADQFDSQGYDSGIKGTCGEGTASTTTAFTSTAETTTDEAATSTASVAPVDPECSSCVGTARVYCDVTLNGLVFTGASSDIAECLSFCEQDDDCQGVSRRQDTGACFKSMVDPDDVEQSPLEGWYSAIKGTCFV